MTWSSEGVKNESEEEREVEIIDKDVDRPKLMTHDYIYISGY